MPYRQSQWRVQLLVDSVDYGEWAGMDGAGVEAEDGSYEDWDGTVRIGGTRSREDATLRKLYREQVHGWYRALDAKVGAGHCTIIKTPTRDDGQSWGSPIVYTGILGGVKSPEVDKSSSDGGEIEVTVQLDPNLA